MCKLQSVILSKNQFTSVPTELSVCQVLVEIDLSSNKVL